MFVVLKTDLLVAVGNYLCLLPFELTCIFLSVRHLQMHTILLNV